MFYIWQALTMNHSCFRVGLLHTTIKRLPAMSEPITITRKCQRLAASTAPSRGGRGKGGASIRGGASSGQRGGPASRESTEQRGGI